MPRQWIQLVAFGLSIAVLSVWIGGCTAPLFRGQSPDADEFDEIVEVAEPEGGVQLVGDLTGYHGVNWLKVEGVALVTQLHSTGSDPPPSPLRDRLIREIQTHDVKNYTRALASADTSLVVVKGYIPPAAEKGDSFDVEVKIPARSQTTSLRNGWLMQSRLRELRVLDTLREGHVEALARGAILVDGMFDPSDETVAESRGRVPGGGTVQRSRQMALVIRGEHSSVRTSALIGAAINDRFHHFDRGSKKGVANPTTDNLVKLALHRRYKNNVGRYLRVIRSIAVGENPRDRTQRLALLQRMLLEPTTAQTAALQLEGIGREAITTLRQGLQSADREVQFYAAEALAFLDEPAATPILYEAARDERAFRWRALTALSTLDTFEAREALVQLMGEVSAETRYGAFRALRARDESDPMIGGQVLNDEFVYHVTGSSGEPMVHFSRTRRAEIVVFGPKQFLRPPSFLYAGESILIKGVDSTTLRLTRFQPGQDDRIEHCSTDLDEVIHLIAKLGGGYADVFAALTTAKSRGYLDSRIEVDALPGANRRYQRDDDKPSESTPNSGSIPEMFQDHLSRQEPDRERELENLDPPKDLRTKKGVFDRIKGWLPGRSAPE